MTSSTVYFPLVRMQGHFVLALPDYAYLANDLIRGRKYCKTSEYLQLTTLLILFIRLFSFAQEIVRPTLKLSVPL